MWRSNALDQVREDSNWGDGGGGKEWMNSRATLEVKSAGLNNRLDMGNREAGAGRNCQGFDRKFPSF